MKYLTILIIILTLFLSCSRENTAILWSSNREAADIVELYNTENKKYRIIFQYKEDLVSSYIKADRKPDILIGEDLQNNDIKIEMANLERLYSRSFQNGETINKALLGGVFLNREKRLLPLSYSLSTAVFKKNSKRIDNSQASIELGHLKDVAIAFNHEQEKRGYSPFWDRDFIYSVLELFGSSFTASETKTLQWVDDDLSKAIDFIKSWNEQNGGTAEMTQFDTKYLYENRIKILKDERILFTTMSSSQFMKLSDNMRRELDFLYISHNSRLHPDHIVYGGVNRRSKAFNVSADFLSWIIKSDTQKKIIENSIKNYSGNFAVFGGFSSLNDVNSLILPQFYPRMTGKIPEPQYVLPQLEKPVDFNSIKNKLITSWVIEESSGNDLSLDEALEKWERLRIPF